MGPRHGHATAFRERPHGEVLLFRLRCTSARLCFFRAQHVATPPTHASELQPQPACITTAYLSRNSFGWMFAPSTMRSPTLGRRKRKMLSKYSSLGAASGDQLSLQTPCQTRLNCLWAVHQEPSLRRNKLDQVEYSVEHILSRPPPLRPPPPHPWASRAP